jgi:hypothetical protein
MTTAQPLGARARLLAALRIIWTANEMQTTP